MQKSFLAFLVFCSVISAQGITVSKDSIQVYNNPIMSFADEIIFMSHSSIPIHLDSAVVVFTELDTAGYSRPGFVFGAGLSFSLLPPCSHPCPPETVQNVHRYLGL